LFARVIYGNIYSVIVFSWTQCTIIIKLSCENNELWTSELLWQ